VILHFVTAAAGTELFDDQGADRVSVGVALMADGLEWLCFALPCPLHHPIPALLVGDVEFTVEAHDRRRSGGLEILREIAAVHDLTATLVDLHLLEDGFHQGLDAAVGIVAAGLHGGAGVLPLRPHRHPPALQRELCGTVLDERGA
jgi:hypothetical protein